jgi:hypothetical protein
MKYHFSDGREILSSQIHYSVKGLDNRKKLITGKHWKGIKIRENKDIIQKELKITREQCVDVQNETKSL